MGQLVKTTSVFQTHHEIGIGTSDTALHLWIASVFQTQVPVDHVGISDTPPVNHIGISDTQAVDCIGISDTPLTKSVCAFSRLEVLFMP